MFDTSIGSLNLGDQIINSSIKANWPEIFSQNYIINLPTHTPLLYTWQNLLLKKRDSIMMKTDYKFVCGTNLLYTNMLRPLPSWNIYRHNTRLARNSILLGVGIGRNSKRVGLYTRSLYRSLLSKEYIHSVRDEQAEMLVKSLGLRVMNTGCPTLWGLTPEFCATIPTKKSKQVIVTLTGYHRDFEMDRLMLEIAGRHYENIMFWPQSFADLDYLHELNVLQNVTVIHPSLDAFKEALSGDVDYIGNRLHGGIFAMQHRRRSIIVGIDYRASTMVRSFSIPYVDRVDLRDQLDRMILSEWPTEITGLDFSAIEQWKKQFT